MSDPKQVRCIHCFCRDLRLTQSVPISRGRVKKYYTCRNCGEPKIVVEDDKKGK